MPFININDIDLYYEVHGEGPVIIFAHGMGGNHLSWWQQIPVFSKDFQCIVYDIRGKGQSSVVTDSPAEGAFREDLKGLLDYLGIQEVYLVCQSMGGLTGTNFTVAYPEKVKGLVLSGAPGGFDPEIDEMEKKRRAAMDEKDLILSARVYAKSFPDDHQAKAFLNQEIRALNPPHRQTDTERVSVQQLADTKVPLFMLAGEEDVLMPPVRMDMYKERLPHAHFLTIPRSGHSPYFEKPDIFNEAVMEFISKIKGQG